MAEHTGIAWTDHTFNPWIGCTKITPACDDCYAADMSARYGWAELGDHPRKRTAETTWRQPLHWDRKAKRDGVRRFVFCASLADVFDNQVEPQWRADLWALIRATPNLDWLVLTKRPQNIVKMVKQIGFMPPNIAFGTTVEDRKRVEANLPHLAVAGGLRPRFLFISAEPLLEDLGDLTPWLQPPGFALRSLHNDPFVSGYLLAVNSLAALERTKPEFIAAVLNRMISMHAHGVEACVQNFQARRPDQTHAEGAKE